MVVLAQVGRGLRRLPPLSFIRPCNPVPVARPPAGPGWLHETKHDGFRILGWKQGQRVTLWSRRGTEVTDGLTTIARAVAGLPAENAIVDGEAVVFHLDGRSDFEALLTREGSELAALVAFDLLRLEGEDLRLRPIEKRRLALSRLVAGLDGVLFSEASAAEGALVFAEACARGLEGIVSKRSGSFYQSGRSRDWLKTRNPEFVRM
jgi:bifunctional non-homologous end joining protein LigD